MNDSDVDTIGGWIMMQNHDIQEGQTVNSEGYAFKILEKDPHQIKRVEIQKEMMESSNCIVAAFILFGKKTPSDLCYG